VHNNTYIYPNIENEYRNEKSKISIICPTHGEFKQLLSNHIRGVGCPLCGNERKREYNRQNPRGWSPKYWAECASKSLFFDSFKVYIIRRWNGDRFEEFYKVGKTYTTVEKRFLNKSYIPYEYEIMNTFVFECPYECSKFEQFLKNYNKDNSYRPNINFKGQFECFKK